MRIDSITKTKQKIFSFLLVLSLLASSLFSEEPKNENGGFYEDWSEGFLSNRWLAYRKIMGTHNNGCVPELITIEKDLVDGKLKDVVVMTAQGNLSKSPIKGLEAVDEGFVASPSSQKVGAFITTTNYYTSGRYEIKMKIGLTNDAPPKAPVGLSPLIMLFHFERHWAGETNVDGTKLNIFDPQYQPIFKEPSPKGYFSTVNAEINAPELGLDGDFSRGSYNTFISTAPKGFSHQRIKLPVDILDGKYHTYRTEWHTKLIQTDLTDDQVRPQGAYYYVFDYKSPLQGFPVVKKPDCKWYAFVGSSAIYYIDGMRIGESTENIPCVSARLTIGASFPQWAGIPMWDKSRLYIAEVTITPFNDEGDVIYQPETFPFQGLVPRSLVHCFKQDSEQGEKHP